MIYGPMKKTNFDTNATSKYASLYWNKSILFEEELNGE